MRQRKIRNSVVAEYLEGGITLRELGTKHGINFRTIHRWVKAYERDGVGGEIEERLRAMGEMPEDVKMLQRELYEARLKTKLYETMIDIAERDLGIPIRKKHGAK